MLNVFIGSLFVSQWSRHRDIARFICTLIENKFYDPALIEDWVKECRSQIDDISIFDSQKSVFERMQRQMDQLQISHLQLFTPIEEHGLWTGQNLDTGLRIRFFETGAIVVRVYPKSSAEHGGVHVGDRLRLVNGRALFSTDAVQVTKGEYEFERSNKRFRTYLQPTLLLLDESPSVKRADAFSGLLTIPSFRDDFFEANQWKKVVRSFEHFDHVIVDVRGNAGGNFVAMLRALSPFMCRPTLIGEVHSSRVEGPVGTLFDDMADERQVQLVERHHRIWLKTFRGYGCYQGYVTVLADSQTASVAEIFVAGMRLRPKTRLLGSATAGDVALGVWYALPYLPSGFSISVPEAIFKTADGEILEGQGIWPDRALYYIEQDALKGQDTWILQAENRVDFKGPVEK